MSDARPKLRILYWGDAPTVSTGFGVVARHVLRALHDDGYRVDCLSVNTSDRFHDPREFPYTILPAATSAQDRAGARSFARALSAPGALDLVLAQNDLSATHAAAGYINQLRAQGKRLPPIVHYYPVDCAVRADFSGMLGAADINVTCTEFGRRETLKTFPDHVPRVIPHGVDTRSFYPLRERVACRQAVRRAFNVAPEAQLICAVAANSVRKDLPRTLAAFAALRSRHTADAVLYLHTNPISNGIDLNAAAASCGLVVGRDVIFPNDYHPCAGIPDVALNELYNAADLYFTTSLGEGWGLPVTEAMAAGLTVVAPRHTSLAELGAQDRALLYDCREAVWVDNSGYRPLGALDDIVAALARATALSSVERERITTNALTFARSLDWSRVVPHWLALIRETIEGRARL